MPFPAFLTQPGSGGLLGARTGRPRWLRLTGNLKTQKLTRLFTREVLTERNCTTLPFKITQHLSLLFLARGGEEGRGNS